VIKLYHAPEPPVARALAHPALDAATKQRLRALPAEVRFGLAASATWKVVGPSARTSAVFASPKDAKISPNTAPASVTSQS
jgi:hypothetical protein